MHDRWGKKKKHCTSLHTVPQNTFRVNEVQTEPNHRSRKQHVSKPIQLEIMLGFYQDDKNTFLSIFGYIIIG